MNKRVFFITIIIVAILSVTIYLCNVLINNNEKNNIDQVEENIYISKQIEDECTEEFIENQDIETVSIEQEKVSANAILILKKYYTNCDHTINEYVELPKEIVNMTQEKVAQAYPDWNVIGFSADKVTLYREFLDTCGEHFKLKLENGGIVIYLINNDGTEVLYEKTNISSEYLTEDDLINMKNGLYVYGKEELNKIIEDFE